jgi:ribose transport system permease protein
MSGLKVKSGDTSLVRRILSDQEKSSLLIIYSLLIGVVLLAGLINPGFLTLQHLMDLTKQAAPLIIVSLGQAVVMLMGNVSLDLSVESVIVLVNVVCTTLFTRTEIDPFFLMMILMGMAVIIGLINGIGTAVFKIEPFIMTLGMMTILRGVAMIISGGTPGGMVPAGLVAVVKARLLGALPLVTVIWICLAAFMFFILNRTSFGRKVHMVGSNNRLAYLSGISPTAVKIMAYIICSTLAMAAGLELTGYIGTGSVIIGGGFSFMSITAAVIGGISFKGGIGNLLGPVAGALIMTVLVGLLTAINIPQAGRFVLQGVVILIFVTIYSIKEHRNA